MTGTEQQRARKRLLRAFRTVPGLAETLLSECALEEKREKACRALASRQLATFDHDPEVPQLKWVHIRDAVGVFHSLLSRRNEAAAGFSFLAYIDAILHGTEVEALPVPSRGFIAEVVNLCRGVAGTAKMYAEQAPAFTRHQGQRAARQRSAYLSRLAKVAERTTESYAHGLTKAVIRHRSYNKQRILNHFGATDFEWNEWTWQTRHIIRDAEALRQLVELTDDEHEAILLARKHGIPFGITPYYVSLMDPRAGGRADRAVRAQVIPSKNYVQSICRQERQPEQSMDFMLERDTSPIEGVTRRYPAIAIIKPVMTCPQICVYCQRNWEITDVCSKTAMLPKKKLEQAIAWIGHRPEIKEVLITGGDPLLLNNQKIESLLWKISKLDHVERIRIGTRTPVTLPQRITDSLVRDINHFHVPGRREILIVTHFEHPYEITPEAMEAVQKFRRYGIEVYNQLVYTFFNSRRFEACALRKRLRLIGVTPYYTFNTKGKEETSDFRVPIARLLQEQKEETRLFPGSVRTDEVVFNVPRLGKNYLRAQQHHNIVTILPDGRRVYEFHPWEKHISPAETYLYTDVSIYDYLHRLKEAGEDAGQYRTIWYYY